MITGLRRAVIARFARHERVIAWSMFVLSLVAFVSIVASIWKVDDPVVAALVAVTIVWDGFNAVQEAEDDVIDDIQDEEDEM